ncbi:PEP-CTERM sorting domain-containing protein [Geopsychrobacter electrodiphilus]|uniref:PEP-CTERM sorting domain-containing protein n=1 Tax=Geopsychrobacter electrodiphilus TaxID=225196 RepID=UPI00037215B0|nr:PEP-CTERM sorting domain-containing protein [Geopsychrobacter electrodiphilus]
MKKIRIVLIAYICIVVSASTASALTFYQWDYGGTDLYSGEYMFTVLGNLKNNGGFFSANDTEATMALSDMKSAAENWFTTRALVRDVDFTFYSKVDAADNINGNMTISYASDNRSGTWATAAPIEFYTVKGSNEFALYWINGGADSGDWSTRHLVNGGSNQPGISHLSTWNEVSIVPEPSTLLLLGAGLIGLAWSRRKS